jgi:hypothetical protein
MLYGNFSTKKIRCISYNGAAAQKIDPLLVKEVLITKFFVFFTLFFCIAKIDKIELHPHSNEQKDRGSQATLA